MKNEINIPKRGVWGGYKINFVGPAYRGYYWIGQGNKYLMALTVKQARAVSKFLAAVPKP